MISRIKSAVINGLEVVVTDIEVGFTRALPGLTIVGLPDNAVKESKERIRFAIKNSGFQYPVSTKIVVNLSPADIKKEGAALDLPMAVGILKNQYELEGELFDDSLFLGELNLDGELKPVRGILNIALHAREIGFKRVIVPYQNALEASFVKRIEIVPVHHLHEVMAWIHDPANILPLPQGNQENSTGEALDFEEIKGQYMAKRVLEIAAAGFHNVLLIGPPGSGKSMMAKALPTILPDMTEEQILETSLIYSAAGLLNQHTGLITRRPFRSPHHTISDVGISGGGKYPAPGEISLAHHGVLFLDELPYFKRSALEVLRQPMEDGKITISRSLTSHTYPARFMLVSAMNTYEESHGITPEYFPAGSGARKRQYYSKISKPLLDRIDLQIEVKKINLGELTSDRPAESSREIRERVVRAQRIQLQRLRAKAKSGFANGQMSNPEIRQYCELDSESQSLLHQAVEKFDMSARCYFKILKTSRTIADLDGEKKISRHHVQEALQYRLLDLSRWMN